MKNTCLPNFLHSLCKVFAIITYPIVLLPLFVVFQWLRSSLFYTPHDLISPQWLWKLSSSVKNSDESVLKQFFRVYLAHYRKAPVMSFEIWIFEHPVQGISDRILDIVRRRHSQQGLWVGVWINRGKIRASGDLKWATDTLGFYLPIALIKKNKDKALKPRMVVKKSNILWVKIVKYKMLTLLR